MATDVHGSEARLRREQVFHDARFTAEVREAQHGFYAGLDDSRDAFDDALTSFIPGDRVLELGCGPSSAGWDLARRGIEVLGIDISPVAVVQANELAVDRRVDNIDFRVMNAEALDLADGSVDGVIGAGILHHLDLDNAYGEIGRVLTPTGRAVFLEPLGHNALINLYRRLTPASRTVDEHPLTRSDFDAAHRHFRQVGVSTHHLLSMVTGPLRARRWGRTIGDWLARADRQLVRVPGLRWQAWIAVVELSEPRP